MPDPAISDRLTILITLVGLVAVIAFPLLVAWSVGAIRRRR